MSSPTDETLPDPRSVAAGEPDTASDPEQIGEFVILAKLGEGSFGQVYLARQSSLGREVALKVTRPVEPGSYWTAGSVAAGGAPHGSEQTAHKEAQLLASLEHDHIVKVYSEFRDETTGNLALCLQYVPGSHLGAIIQQVHTAGTVPESGDAILAALDETGRGEAGFDPAALRDRDALGGDDFSQAVCRIGARLAEALAFAHSRGVLHCDIKPANILLTPYGRPMLADFNVAFDRNRYARGGEQIGGTLAYMAPEHRHAVTTGDGSAVDERCDVYSLGVVLHELATGERPAPPHEEPKSPLDRVPRELAAVIRRCLMPHSADRYPRAADLADALNGAWELLAARRALPPPSRVGRWVTANPVSALVLAAVIPHVAASAVNIGYNAVEIRLTGSQEQVFLFLILGYNLIAYPLCVGTAVLLLVRIRRRLAGLRAAPGRTVDETRRIVLRFGWRVMALGALGWLPGGLIFPLVIDLATGPLEPSTYAHYAVSFTLAGLIGVVFSYLAIQYVVFRAVLPYLGNPDDHAPPQMWAEVRPHTTPFGLFLILACAVPLTGAVLLVALADERMTIGFRILVTGLIGLGVGGVGVAERLTRRLRSLAAAWHSEARG